MGWSFTMSKTNKDTEIHQNGSLRWKANHRAPYFVPEHDICVWSILLLKQYRWKNSYQCLGKTNENGSKNSVFPPWPTLDCFHKEYEHQFINVFLYPPPSLHIYTLLIFLKFYLLLVDTVLGAKPTLWDLHNLTQKGKRKGMVDRAFLQEAYHMSFGFTVYGLSLSRISKLASGICPSKPKQVSLLLISFPISLKTRLSLNFHIVFWGFLQGAITLGQQQPEILLVLHRSQFCHCSLRMPQGKNKNVRTSPFLSPERGPCNPFLLRTGSKVFCSHHPLTP